MLVSVLVFVQWTLCNTLLVSDAARLEAETEAVEINSVNAEAIYERSDHESGDNLTL